MNKNSHIKIEEINKENPFTVPENYFENFSVRMADKISETKEVKVKVDMVTWLRTKYAVTLAFSGIVLIVLIGVLILQHKSNPLSSQQMVEAYQYSAINDLSDEQLAQMIADKQVKSDTSSTYKNDVINYLSKENIDMDINTIIEAQ